MMTPTISVLLLLVLPAFSLTQREAEFSGFKTKFGKVYETPAEEAKRFAIFSDNVKSYSEMAKTAMSYTVGVTQFSDLTEEEFKSTYLGGNKRPNPGTQAPKSSSLLRTDLPASIDWREKEVISEVKNQGQCGSCWAFATTEQVESYAAINSPGHPLLELSTQQVTSCAPNTLSCGGVGGCKGSIAQLGYSYLQLFGHTLEESWPYTSGQTTQTGDCTFDIEATAPAVTLAGYDTLPSNNQDAVLAHVANVGPLAVNVDASRWSSYNGGVFDGCDFNQNMDLNHVVQLVGYTEDAWIVRNSWGTGWGEDGYIRLAKGDQCGTDNSPLDGTGCAGDPGDASGVQHPCGQCGLLFDASYPLGAKVVGA